LNELRKLDVQLAMDNFKTGYSSRSNHSIVISPGL